MDEMPTVTLAQLLAATRDPAFVRSLVPDDPDHGYVSIGGVLYRVVSD